MQPRADGESPDGRGCRGRRGRRGPGRAAARRGSLSPWVSLVDPICVHTPGRQHVRDEHVSGSVCRCRPRATSSSCSKLGSFHHAARPRSAPNPWVGAVVVDGTGRIVGTGATAPPGGPPPEVAALAEAGDARAATVYVTLEPCRAPRPHRPVRRRLGGGRSHACRRDRGSRPAVSGGRLERLRRAGRALRRWSASARSGSPVTSLRTCTTAEPAGHSHRSRRR